MKLRDGVAIIYGLGLSWSVTSAYAAEDDLYQFDWLDKDKQVYVLQNKLYKKEKRVYVSLGALSSQNSPYQDTKGGALSVEYYWHENWGLDFITHVYQNKDNEDKQNIQRINQSTPFVRKVNSQYGVLATWSPFYGKINTFNHIYYFDWSVGLGPTLIQTESNRETVAEPSRADVFTRDRFLGAAAKTQVKFHVNKRVHVSLGMLRTQYKAPGPELPDRPGQQKWQGFTDTVISVGFSF